MHTILRLGIFTGSLLLSLTTSGQTNLTINPLIDNTLYEHNSGNLSNGAGQHLFTGKTRQGNLRRALLMFNIADTIPTGATITAITLSLNVSNARGGNQPFSLHRVTKRWGEGNSNASGDEGRGTSPQNNDATWIHSFFNDSTWISAGGDFEGTASASQNINNDGIYNFSSPQMIVDVQDMLENPDSNFGWIIKHSNENNNQTAKRFDSKEHGTAANRPQLMITYTAAVPIELSSLSAAQKSNEIFISWSTASEINNDYFTLERSPDGITFSEIIEMEGAGNSHESLHYSHTDINPLPGNNYYRLKQTDFDGTQTLSDQIVVSFQGSELDLQVFPNPFTNHINIEISKPFKGGNLELQLIDVNGKIIDNELSIFKEYNQSFSFLSSHLVPGVYFLRIRSHNFSKQIRLLKL